MQQLSLSAGSTIYIDCTISPRYVRLYPPSPNKHSGWLLKLRACRRHASWVISPHIYIKRSWDSSSTSTSTLKIHMGLGTKLTLYCSPTYTSTQVLRQRSWRGGGTWIWKAALWPCISTPPPSSSTIRPCPSWYGKRQRLCWRNGPSIWLSCGVYQRNTV